MKCDLDTYGSYQLSSVKYDESMDKYVVSLSHPPASCPDGQFYGKASLTIDEKLNSSLLGYNTAKHSPQIWVPTDNIIQHINLLSTVIWPYFLVFGILVFFAVRHFRKIAKKNVICEQQLRENYELNNSLMNNKALQAYQTYQRKTNASSGDQYTKYLQSKNNMTHTTTYGVYVQNPISTFVNGALAGILADEAVRAIEQHSSSSNIPNDSSFSDINRLKTFSSDTTSFPSDSSSFSSDSSSFGSDSSTFSSD